ncbi:putative transcription factor B3-Domain family [Helianthus annuus]|nr:putative transcription factor B3-Domain family [Helianthus annuus]
MDSSKNRHSFLAFVDDEEPILMEIPIDFAKNLWGDKIPYYQTVEIRDGDKVRKMRIRKKNDGPVFTDGWMWLVKENQLKNKDGVRITAVGQLNFEVLCFKDLVCKNTYITAQVECDYGNCVMPDKFYPDFYGNNFKGGMAKVIFGERFWNVRLEGGSNGGYFTDGWEKVVEELPIDKYYYFVFSSLDLLSFAVSVFDPDTGTEVFLKKSTADDDMIVEQKLPADVCEENLEGNKKHVKVKSRVDETQPKRNLRSRIKRVDAAASNASPVLKSTETTKRNLRSRIKKVDEAPLTGSPYLKSTNLKKRKKTLQTLNPQSTVLNFKRIAEHRIRLPPKMSSVLELSPTNLKEVSVQNQTGEVNFIMTRSEKNRKVFRYAFVGWSNYLKAWNIKMGAELFFEFNHSTKVLTLTKVVEKRGVKKKKSRA